MFLALPAQRKRRGLLVGDCLLSGQSFSGRTREVQRTSSACAFSTLTRTGEKTVRAAKSKPLQAALLVPDSQCTHLPLYKHQGFWSVSLIKSRIIDKRRPVSSVPVTWNRSASISAITTWQTHKWPLRERLSHSGPVSFLSRIFIPPFFKL